MRKFFSVLVAGMMVCGTLILGTASVSAATITISSDTFPDSAFRKYVKSLNGGSTSLTSAAIKEITSMDLSGLGIEDLTGIEYFTSLKTLRLSSSSYDQQGITDYTTLDYSAYAKDRLNGSDEDEDYDDDEDYDEDEDYDDDEDSDENYIEELNLNALTSLRTLYCSNLGLISLKVSACEKLVTLDASGNDLESLNISNLTGLKTVNLQDNAELTSLKLSGDTALETLNINYTGVSSLNLTGSTALKALYADEVYFDSLNLKGLEKLATLEVKGSSGVQEQLANLTGLKYLNISGGLEAGGADEDDEDYDDEDYDDEEYDEDEDSPEVSEDELSSLDLSANTELLFLDVSDSDLWDLDISGCTKLTYIFCNENNLRSLDVTICPSLQILLCGDNYLTELDTSANTALTLLDLTPADYHVHVSDALKEEGYDCEVGGTFRYTCDECLLDVTDVRSPKEHTWQYVGGESATCLEQGWQYLQCEECGKAKLDFLPLTDHIWRWDSSGKMYVCSICGSEKDTSGKIIIGDHEHSYTLSFSVTPTCQHGGTLEEICSICGDIRKTYTVDKTDHDPLIQAAVEPTCTENGMTERTYCSMCGITLSGGEVLPALGHDVVTDPALETSCAASGLTEGSHCARCGEVFVPQEVIDPLPHTFETTIQAATPSKDGVIRNVCAVCGDVEEGVIPSPSGFTLSVTSYGYTGKAKKPKVTVTDSAGTTVDPSAYTISYTDNVNVGKGYVTVSFDSERYTGTKKISFTIRPANTAITSLEAASRGFTVTWKKKTKQVSGYQVQYYRKKDLSDKKTVTIKDTKTVSLTVKGLTADRKYYVKVRTWTMVGTKKKYGSWTEVMNVRTLK